MKRQILPLRDQNGVIAIMTILWVSILALAVLATVTLVSSAGLKMTGSAYASERTFNAAEAGLNQGIYRLTYNAVPGTFCVDFNGIPCVVGTKDKVTVTVAAVPPPGDPYQRTVTAKAEDVSGKVRTVFLSVKTGSFARPFSYAVMSGQGGYKLGNDPSCPPNTCYAVDGGTGDGVYTNGSVDGQGINNSTIHGDLKVTKKVTIQAGVSAPAGGDVIFARTTSLTSATSFILPDSVFPLDTEQVPLNNISLKIKKQSAPADDAIVSIVRNVVVLGVDTPSISPNDLIIQRAVKKADVQSTYPATPFKLSFETSNGVIPVGPPLYKSEKYWIVLSSITSAVNKYYLWDQAYTLQVGMTSDPTVNDVRVTGATSTNQNPSPFPIARTDIKTLKNAILSSFPMPAAGDYSVNGQETFNGPRIINGNLVFSGNGSKLTLQGNLWVTGNIVFNHPSQQLTLDPSLNEFSGMVIADGFVDLKNGAVVSGTGNAKSSLIIISTMYSFDVSQTHAIDAKNLATSVIYYAPNGIINIKNGGFLHNATGFLIQEENVASVVYDPNILITTLPPSGPSTIGAVGGTWHEL